MQDPLTIGINSCQKSHILMVVECFFEVHNLTILPSFFVAELAYKTFSCNWETFTA